ncbi:putative DNA topoisomerase I [Firmicutes bacterium CAG:882]|jgi:hypothetical protein|nr:putative DNA topoisomerase I [Firmicutes bacterium CAG:882]
MIESKAIKELHEIRPRGGIIPQKRAEALDAAIQALEEVQQYRAIGTPEELQDMKSNYFEALSDWRQYRTIGTVEECRAAVEKQTAISRELIEGKYFCPKCHNLMPYPGYCGCGQKVY